MRHPNSKQTIETNNPDAYLTQGWLEVKPKPAEK